MEYHCTFITILNILTPIGIKSVCFGRKTNYWKRRLHSGPVCHEAFKMRFNEILIFWPSEKNYLSCFCLLSKKWIYSTFQSKNLCSKSFSKWSCALHNNCCLLSLDTFRHRKIEIWSIFGKWVNEQQFLCYAQLHFENLLLHKFFDWKVL